MAELTTQASEQIVESCKGNLSAISQSFNSAIGSKYQLEVSSLRTGATLLDEASNEPGLMVLFEVGGQGIACLIPESLPLPGWYRSPNDSQKSQLQTLAMEWATAMLPLDLEATQYVSIACGDLKRQLMACSLSEEPQLLQINLRPPMGGPAPYPIQIFWPLGTPRFHAVGDWPTIPQMDAEEAEEQFDAEFESHFQPAVSNRLRRVLHVPVSVVVRIAEKRIDLRQLRQLAPGMLLTFDKNCDAPLDVYISNQLHCRGEVVKMGEHFAIKINETGSQPNRVQKVFTRPQH